MQLLLDICDNFSKKWAIEFNPSKSKFIVFGSNKFSNTKLYLNGRPITYSNTVKYLGIEFNNTLYFSNFFINKFKAVSNSFFSFNSFGFKPGGINPFLQSFIYKSYCISRLLYGFEILTISKKTLKNMNISQNNIIRYMTGLSRNSHISNTRKILKLLSIDELSSYMKLTFVKNLINNNLCIKFFDYLLNTNYKNNTKSFIKEFMDVCILMNLNHEHVINNINTVSKDFKNSCVEFDKNTETDLILTCLNNNHDFNMINQLNLVTYAGPLYDVNNINN